MPTERKQAPQGERGTEKLSGSDSKPQSTTPDHTRSVPCLGCRSDTAGRYDPTTGQRTCVECDYSVNDGELLAELDRESEEFYKQNPGLKEGPRDQPNGGPEDSEAILKRLKDYSTEIPEEAAKIRIDLKRLAKGTKDKTEKEMFKALAKDALGRGFGSVVDAAFKDDQGVEAESREEYGPEQREEDWEKCKGLATAPNILELFGAALRSSGVVGVDDEAKLIYLMLSSRGLDRPISGSVKGTSSAGKSHVVKRTCRFFPWEAYLELTSMSEKALIYMEDNLEHRFLILAEAHSFSSEFASFIVRNLLSEGRLTHRTVETGGPKIVSRKVEKEGPTGIITTTTNISLHPENETRMLSVTLKDTQEQTKAIMRSIADEEKEIPDYDLWHSLQRWVGSGDYSATIPFSVAIADLTPPRAVRLRRDLQALLDLVKTHAILHQATRERDETGRVIATLADYEAIRRLVEPIFSEGLELTVSKAVRETVRAVEGLLADGSAEVKVSQLVPILNVERRSAARRSKQAREAGYLNNLETREKQAMRLVLGDTTMPGDDGFLPTVEKLKEKLVLSLPSIPPNGRPSDLAGEAPASNREKQGQPPNDYDCPSGSIVPLGQSESRLGHSDNSENPQQTIKGFGDSDTRTPELGVSGEKKELGDHEEENPASDDIAALDRVIRRLNEGSSDDAGPKATPKVEEPDDSEWNPWGEDKKEPIS